MGKNQKQPITGSLPNITDEMSQVASKSIPTPPGIATVRYAVQRTSGFVVRWAIHWSNGEKPGATRNNLGWTEKLMTRPWYMRRTIGVLRTIQSQWAIPRRIDSSFWTASTFKMQSRSWLSTATRSIKPNGSQGRFASITRKPSSRTAALPFRNPKIASRLTVGESCNRKGVRDGARSDGACAGVMPGISDFSFGLSEEWDRNRWETSSKSRERRFSGRPFSSRGSSVSFFRWKSKLLGSSAVAQKIVQISGYLHRIQSRKRYHQLDTAPLSCVIDPLANAGPILSTKSAKTTIGWGKFKAYHYMSGWESGMSAILLST
jgi:hypothetical protein